MGRRRTVGQCRVKLFPAFLMGSVLALCVASTAVPATSTTTEPTTDVCASEVVLVEAGQEVAFLGNRSLTSGIWSAAFGTVTPDGRYRAPAAVPPDGIDTIDYYDSADGTFASVIVRVQAAGGTVPPTALAWTDEGATATADPPPGEPATGSGTTTTSGAAVLSRSAAGATAGVSETQDGDATVSGMTPVTVSEVTTIAAETLNGQTVYRIPSLALIRTDPTLLLYAQTERPLQKARKCGVLPPPWWIGQSCTNGSVRAVIGPTQTTSYTGREYAGTITVSAGLSADIKKIFGINVSVGTTVQVYKEVRRYRQWYNKDVYQCVNGRWQFAYTRQCSRTGVQYYGWTPAWASLVYGNPSGTINWSAWACRNL